MEFFSSFQFTFSDIVIKFGIWTNKAKTKDKYMRGGGGKKGEEPQHCIIDCNNSVT